MHTGERPLPEDFLGMLIDVHNYDAWVNRCGTGRTIAKTGIERGEFQTLQEVQDGCGAVSKKGEVIERQGGDGDAQTDQKRGAVLPPGDEQFVDAESAAALRPFRRRVFHQRCRGRSRTILKKERFLATLGMTGAGFPRSVLRGTIRGR